MLGVLDGYRQLAQVLRLLGRAARHRERSQVLFQVVPQPYARAVTVDDLRYHRHEALGDLVARTGLSHGAGEREQRADLCVAPRRLLERDGHVEHRRGVLRVEAEQVVFLREELDAAGIARDQLSVLTPG